MRAATLLALVLVTASGASTPEAQELIFASTRAPQFHDEVFSLDTRTGALRSLSRNPTRDAEPAPSPDRTRVAFVSDRGDGEAVWTMTRAGRGLRRLHAPLDRTISSVQWSRDGTWIAFQIESRDFGVYVVPARGGRARRLAAGALNAAWLPRNRLAIWTESGVVVRATGGSQLWRRAGKLGAVSSRGEVAIASRGRLQIVGADGRVRTSVRGKPGSSWSPDGSLLAYAFGDTVRVLDSRNRVRRLSRTPLKNPGEWTPDGRSLLARDARSDTLLRVTLDGRTTRVGVSGGTWSPDGRSLLGGDDRGGIAVWRAGSAARTLLRENVGEPCPVRYGEAVWLDDRYAVVAIGRGGQRDADLWSIARDGTALRRLRRGVDWASSPDVSPDRSRVVYESGDVLTHGGGCSGLKPHLRIATRSGSGDARLTEDEPGGSHQTPRWAPSGRLVAYARRDLGEASGFGVFVVDVETKRKQRISTGFHEHVSWAPDSRRLAFSGRRSLWVANVESGTPTRIGSGERPEWMPGGERIAFVRSRELWTVRPDGNDPRRLSTLRPTGELRWSRDGTLLAFAVREGIVVIGADGIVRRRIAHPGARHPRLSRDGAVIAYVGPVGTFSREAFSGSARTDLFVADVRGGAPRRLTRDFAEVGAPTWR